MSFRNGGETADETINEADNVQTSTYRVLQVIATTLVILMVATIISMLNLETWSKSFHLMIGVFGLVSLIFILPLIIGVDADTIALIYLVVQILFTVGGSLVINADPKDIIQKLGDSQYFSLAWYIYIITTLAWFIMYLDVLKIRTRIRNWVRGVASHFVSP